MAKSEYSKYQKQLINQYYKNRDDIMLTKISQLVTEIFLAKPGPKLQKLWDRAHKAMINLKIPPPIINHIMEKKNPQILAKNLQDWLKNKK